MDLRASFLREQWDAKEAVVGNYLVLMYEMATPNAKFHSIVHCMDDKIIYTRAEDSFDQNIAGIVLDHACQCELDLEASRITLVAGSYEPHAPFAQTVIVPPSLGLFGHFSDDIRRRIFLAIPSFSSEFSDSMSVKDYRHQVGRKDGWRVAPFRWDRAERTVPSWTVPVRT